ncbi:glycoside hydrolase family 2 protein [Xylona heveae TC161]|uniref:Beta-mannosidase B n=1 Tax=Xylona heveae (strain CBS 132557 / TC161) TaxID=1328760 RepID=A0A165GB57_XYLHT|nr:glycoside hydrolase family 2 protein [Xylona heveae TC161]KZF21976.1 glycoside hydrolase family 2 protein [Xylona heveae TC161]
MARTTIPLDTGWIFKQAEDESSGYLPVSQFPTNIHLDLLAHGLIQDPYLSTNENDVQWIGEKSWAYKTHFKTPNTHLSTAILKFHGLDTFATVFLNGKQILESDNMFVPRTVTVTDKLMIDGDNELLIVFESAFLKGKKIVEKYPKHHWGCWNGDPSRLAVRKAQYHYGWDWGPVMLTCGPWRPVELELYDARISYISTTATVSDDLKSAELTADVHVDGKSTHVLFEITRGAFRVAKEMIRVESKKITATFRVQNPELWFPARYGKQPLYELKATLLTDGNCQDSLCKRFGFRKVEVVRRELDDSPGSSFFFRINNIPIFCGGSDWIPADCFIPRLKPQDYREWVQFAAKNNHDMLRVWGGGIYEEQAFYEACDEFGLLVWQDFLFACGNYPAHPEFLESVKEEAESNIKALKHHPCIVIWAGNNEDYQYRESEGLDYDPDDKDTQSWLKGSFPARYIYEKLLVEITRDLIPETFYHFGSPWGGKDTRDPTVGDIHQWSIWHGGERYQDFGKLSGRFVSEFGMQALPDVKTIDSFLPAKSHDRYAQSLTLDFHNKASGHEEKLSAYLTSNLRYTFDPLEKYIYSTQLMQAECLATAYRLWKREWKGPNREYCGGALVWQLNDCWPVTSWAIADYYRRPKLASYAIKRELSSITIGMARIVEEIPEDQYTRVFIKKVHKVQLWATNLTLQRQVVDVVVKAWNVLTGEEIFSQTVSQYLVLEENRTTEIQELLLPRGGKDFEEGIDVVLAAYLLEQGHRLARCVNWFEPLKYVPLQDANGIKLELSENRKEIHVSAAKPVKGVALETDDMILEDNCIDLVPGETVTVGVQKCGKTWDRDRIRLRFLGQS